MYSIVVALLKPNSVPVYSVAVLVCIGVLLGNVMRCKRKKNRMEEMLDICVRGTHSYIYMGSMNENINAAYASHSQW